MACPRATRVAIVGRRGLTGIAVHRSAPSLQAWSGERAGHPGRAAPHRHAAMTEREDPWRRPAHPALGCCADASGARAGSRRGSIAALLALLAVGIGTTAAVALGVDAGLALATLKSHHAWLLGFVAGAPVMASLLFMAVYALAVAVSVPGLAVLTVIGGYLFGWLEGSAYVLVATTPAATGLFLVAQSALGAPLRARAGPALLRFAEEFRDHAASYVFVLHLVPIFPYA